MTKKQINILVISDNKNGHLSQVKGVLKNLIESFEATNILKYQTSIIANNYFKYLIVFLINANFMNYKFLQYVKNIIVSIVISKQTRLYLQLLLQNKVGSVLILGIGSKTIGESVFIKQTLIQHNIKVKLVYLMPAKAYIKHIDCFFYHEYKTKATLKYKNNKASAFAIKLAPHNFLVNNTIHEQFNNLAKPILGILIGGDAKNINFNINAAKTLAKKICEIHKIEGGSVIVSTSRRTPIKSEMFFKEYLEKYISNLLFYGFNTTNNNTNPYNDILKYSNNIIVTGESISMLSEAVSCNTDIGVYVYFDESFYAKRYVNFHNTLYNNNFAQPLSNYFNNKHRVSYNVTKEVSDKIKNLIQNM